MRVRVQIFTPTVTRFVRRYFVTQGVCHSGRVSHPSAFLPRDLLYWEPGDRAVHDEGPPLDGPQPGGGERPDERRAVDVEARGVRRRAGPVRGHAGVEAAVLHPRRADVEVRYDVAVDGHVLPDQVPEKAGGKSYFAFGQQSVHPPSMGRESDGSDKRCSETDDHACKFPLHFRLYFPSPI